MLCLLYFGQGISLSSRNVPLYCYREHYCSVPFAVGQQPQFQPPPPRSIVAVKGSQVSIPCHAIGNPNPVIKWFFGKDTSALQSDAKYHIAANGTLHINNIGKEDATTYKCTAENLVGKIKRNTSVEIACKSNF